LQLFRIDQFRRTLSSAVIINLNRSLIAVDLRAISQEARSYLGVIIRAPSRLRTHSLVSGLTQTLAATTQRPSRRMKTTSVKITSVRVACDYKANKLDAPRDALSFGEQRGGLVAYSRRILQARTVTRPSICLGRRDLYRSYPAPATHRHRAYLFTFRADMNDREMRAMRKKGGGRKGSRRSGIRKPGGRRFLKVDFHDHLPTLYWHNHLPLSHK